MADEKLKEEKIEIVAGKYDASPENETTATDEKEGSATNENEGAVSDSNAVVRGEPLSSENENAGKSEIDLDDDSSVYAGKVSFAQKVVGDRFEVLDVIGQGGMGAVYKVSDKQTGNVVALKLLKPELCQDRTVLKRFQYEAESLAELNHDNIITVYDHGITNDGAPYLVMQYLDGGTLADVIKEHGKLDPNASIELMLQMCKALSYAHKQKFVHRDMKPSNVLLVGQTSLSESHPAETASLSKSQVQLVDFGIAKILETPAANTTNLTQTGDVFGTPAYMSPEQCQGGELDHRTDIYSLGCILYEMLTGKQPFFGANAIQVALKHINGKPDSFTDKLPDDHILRSLEEIILKCMKKNPNDRYQSIDELVNDLNLVKAGQVVGYAESDDEETLSGPKEIAPVKLVQNVAGTLKGGFALTMYMLMIIAFMGYYDDPAGSNSAQNTLIVCGSIGFLMHFKRGWLALARIKKRRSFLDWVETYVNIALLATYSFALVLGATSNYGSFGDLVGWGTIFCLVSTWLLLGVGTITFMAREAKAFFSSVSGWLRKQVNAQHAPSHHLRVPINFSTGAIRIILSTALLLGGVAAFFPGGTSAVMSHVLSPILTRVDANSSPVFLQSAIVLDRFNTDAYGDLAHFYINRSDDKTAMDVLNTALVAAPLNPELLLARGNLLYDLKQYRSALVDLNRIDTDSSTLLKSKIYLALGDFQKARNEATRAIKMDEFPFITDQAYSQRGLVNYLAGKYADAIQDYSSALENATLDRALIYIRRGLAYQTIGDVAHARENFEAALRSPYRDVGDEKILYAFAARQIGDDDQMNTFLKLAETEGVDKSRLQELVLLDNPVKLNW